MEKLYKYAEASRISGLSVGHLRNLVSLGKLRSEKDFAGNTLIPESALREHQEQAVKYTAPNLMKALQSRRRPEAEDPDAHLFGAIEVLNLFAEDLHGHKASSFRKFLSRHEELRPAVSQLIDAALKELVSVTNDRYDEERSQRLSAKADPFVRGLIAAAMMRKVESFEHGIAAVKAELGKSKKSK